MCRTPLRWFWTASARHASQPVRPSRDDCGAFGPRAVGRRRARKRVCVLGLGGGGFHFQTKRLLRFLEGDLDLVLVYGIHSQPMGVWSSPFPVHRAYVVRSPALYGDSFWRRILLALASFWGALWILL